MILFFERANGEEIEIGKPEDEKEAYSFMKDFMEQQHYESHYIGTTKYTDRIVYDVGSHVEFFILYL